MPKSDHPLGQWFDEDEKRTYEAVAEMCRSAGLEAGDAWIKQISIGYDGPNFALAEFLSEKVTKGKVTVKQLMHYPYSKHQPKRRRRPPKEAA